MVVKGDLRDKSSWSSPPLLLLSDIHCERDDVSEQQGTDPLSLPQLKLLFETSFVWDENSDSNTDVVVIPSQDKVTQQILSHWKTRPTETEFVLRLSHRIE